jgi:uncharacterized protein (DUF2141 family)
MLLLPKVELMFRYCLCVLFAAASQLCTAQTAKLIIIFKGLNTSKGGYLRSALYTKDNFPKSGKESYGKQVNITAKEVQVEFEKLPAGEFAVACYQDIDKNKKLNKNLVGYPSEPFGFSRDAKISLGPPKFEDAKIKLEDNKTLTITINLKQ